MASLIFK